MQHTSRLHSRAKPNATTKLRGRTALHVVSGGRQVSLVRALVNAKAKINKRDTEGNTPLYVAVERGHSAEVVREMLELKASPNIPSKCSQTALMAATWKGKLSVIRALLFFKADTTIKDKHGQTAETQARSNGHRKASDLIKNFPSKIQAMMLRYCMDALSLSCFKGCEEVALVVLMYVAGDLHETRHTYVPRSPLERIKLEYLNAEEEAVLNHAGTRTAPRRKGKDQKRGAFVEDNGDQTDSSVDSLTDKFD
mmetsp:Transcript_17464/g.35251  ORF Transcript_17464/g.35251 Transcript_17464/m.35251 type:complete len:253 (-) Transcript_17464:110-868(-)